MSFRDRLSPCKYTSPSGVAFDVLLYDKLERSGSKRLAVHERPGIDGALFQDMGQSPLEYPLECYIAGADYDLTADAFRAALAEPGRSTFNHPRWGILSVFASTYSQSEDFVDEQRVAKFSIAFVEAPPESSVIGTTSTPAAITSAADLAAEANTASWITKTAADPARIKRTVTKTIQTWRAKLQTIAGAPAAIRSEINAAATLLERTIDTIVTTPVDFCNSMTALARTPAQIGVDVGTKLDTYGALITDAIDRIMGDTEAQAAISSVVLIALDIASVEAAATGTLSSRDDALSASTTIADQYAAIKAAIEALSDTGYYPDADLLATIAALHASLSAYLLDAAFSLRIERRIVLDADWNPLALIHELYGEVDDIDAALDEFIARNGLGGDRLFIIPRGTEVRYYA